MNLNKLVNMATNMGITNSNSLRDDIVSECTSIIDSLDTIDKSVIVKDINTLSVYKINEGYCIDLDSLKYVVESEQVSLQEAIQLIKDTNYIDDCWNMSCLLRENHINSMTLENFCDLCESLNKSGIGVLSESEVNMEDFINETSTNDNLLKNKVDAAKKLAAKTKNTRKLDRLIKSQEKQIQNKQKLISDMKNKSKEEQEKFAKTYAKLLKYSMVDTSKVTINDWFKDMNNEIKTYNSIIKIYKDRIKELESQK